MEMTRAANLSVLAAVFFLLAAPTVFGVTTNVALRRPTSGSVRKSKSCTAGLCKSPNAVDGRYPKAVFNPQSCYHSTIASTPKLRINLGSTTTIQYVNLFSVISKKQSDMERFDGVKVFIGDNKDFSSAIECGAKQPYSFATSGPAYPFTKTCNGTRGKYVFVAIPRREFLILCEVEVFGEPKSPAPPISPPPKPRPPPPPKKVSPPPPKKVSPPPPKKVSPPPPTVSPPPPTVSPPPPPPADGPVSQPRKNLLELSEFDDPVDSDYGLLFPKKEIDY